MSKIKRFWVVALLLAFFVPSYAQLKIGPRVGVAVNSLHFDEKLLGKDNRAGFTAGLQLEFTVPLIGIGGDLSAMYVHRSADWMEENTSTLNTSVSQYIDIPLNLKYKLTLPAISRIICPYVFTGPAFSFLVSKELVDDFKKSKFDVAWNFGFGVELIRHLQVSASYGLGLTKALEYVNLKNGNTADIDGKNRYWTVTAAWLF